MNIIEVKKLVKQYPGVIAVDKISFSIEKGTCFGLLGPNRAGKTTIVEMMEGIIKSNSGSILYKE
jgi:ABC-2 type transport system ATP-binding protein